MAYDTTSPDTAGVRYPASMDQTITDEAAQLAALEDAAQIRAWFQANRNRQPIGGGEDPWAAALGTIQSTVRGLLGIIDRQRDEIASLHAEDQADDEDDAITVPMVCTECRKPVIPSGEHDRVHANGADVIPCGNARRGPVMAMAAAGNESVPRA